MNYPTTYFCISCNQQKPLECFQVIHVDKYDMDVVVKKCNECETKKNNKQAISNRTKKIKVRIKMLSLLGGKCVCCGESNWWNLTTDHIKPIRSKKRTTLYGQFNQFIQDPSSLNNFQCLCFGCNASKNDDDCCKLDHNLKITNVVKPKVVPNVNEHFWDDM